MVIRYFEITEIRVGVVFTAVEYYGDFGSWAHRNAKFAFSKPVEGQLWVVFSDHYITTRTVDELCEQLVNRKPDIYVVDMAAISNPVSKRTPAMKGRRKK